VYKGGEKRLYYPQEKTMFFRKRKKMVSQKNAPRNAKKREARKKKKLACKWAKGLKKTIAKKEKKVNWGEKRGRSQREGGGNLVGTKISLLKRKKERKCRKEKESQGGIRTIKKSRRVKSGQTKDHLWKGMWKGGEGKRETFLKHTPKQGGGLNP